jgi:phosphoadenosine phosphosulfate reductase
MPLPIDDSVLVVPVPASTSPPNAVVPHLIKDGSVVADRWTLLRDAPDLFAVPDGVAVIVPLALWHARRAALIARGDAGVWLAPGDDPAALADDLDVLPLIAIDFPQFTDGRGYSTARLLRDRYQYKGELRAIGDVLRDQLYALAECGFDAFAIRPDRDATEALASLNDFAGVYAPTTRTPQPWFRRRGTATGAAIHPSEQEHRVAAATDFLRRIATQHRPAVFASSFGAEDMVLLDLIARHALPIRVFTLDTGRLPEETYALIDRARERYRLPIDVYTPDARRLQGFVREHGVNAFYSSVELRKGCCAVRKTEPLARALVAKGAWITGLRRAQSVTRHEVALEEYDAVHGLPKFNPLADWSDEDVWAYLRARNVPYNALHDRGYPSIGCAPCTRAVEPGADVRSGRWWWEAPEHKECGLHGRPSVIAIRAVDERLEAVAP